MWVLSKATKPRSKRESAAEARQAWCGIDTTIGEKPQKAAKEARPPSSQASTRAAELVDTLGISCSRTCSLSSVRGCARALVSLRVLLPLCLSLSLSLYIYVYIYLCVCLCVCVYVRVRVRVCVCTHIHV